MRNSFLKSAAIGAVAIAASAGLIASNETAPQADEFADVEAPMSVAAPTNIQVGNRPYFLVEDMEDSELKETLQSCSEGPFEKTDFSIGHRGACLQFPEHTKESYVAAARQGAGIMECDVTFTKDLVLVCRHAQCDLHTTTNILDTPLAAKCSEPFVPADPEAGTPASAKCCTSDITFREFKSLCGKMDAANRNALTVEEYLDGTANFRTDLYSACGTVLSHYESIQLFKDLDVKFTPELKSPEVEMPFRGFYSQQLYAWHIVLEYWLSGVDPDNVWLQSFNLDDVLQWVRFNPRFGKQAVYLDDEVYDSSNPNAYEDAIALLPELAERGVNIVAPPMQFLVELDENNDIVASDYAIAAKEAGLDIITWTIERSGLLKNGGGFYYSTITDGIETDGDMLEVLHVLAQDVGIIGIFSDWPATVTYYANCFGL